MSQATLSDEAKVFVVQQLACFDTPSEVAKAVKEEFGVEITRQSIEAYDPGKRAGASLSAEYRELFAATRKAFLEDTAAIGIANRAVRLRKIQKLFDLAMTRGNVVAAASLLEQAAKEVGGALTNRREVTGAEGAPIKTDGTIRVEFVGPETVSDAEDPSPGGVPVPLPGGSSV